MEGKTLEKAEKAEKGTGKKEGNHPGIEHRTDLQGRDSRASSGRRGTHYNAEILSAPGDTHPQQVLYTGIRPGSSLSISRIYSVHYFEYMSDFSFPGEKHDFWEVVCVDKGEVAVWVEEKELILHKDDVIFYKPWQFHSVKGTGKAAPNLIIFSFASESPAMQFFENKLLSIDKAERDLLARVIFEARQTFEERLDLTYQTGLIRRPDRPFGAEQLLRSYMENFLIHIYRRYHQAVPLVPTTLPLPERTELSAENDHETRQFLRIVEYLETKIHTHLTVEQICKDNLVGRSKLQLLFADQVHMGVIEYFSRMKIESARQLIRDQGMNFTQIAETLGYTSVHYFSRQFRQYTGMSPSEYAASILARAEA